MVREFYEGDMMHRGFGTFAFSCRLAGLGFGFGIWGLGVTTSTLFAASPVNYFPRLWQTEDGLPQNSVTAIVQTHDGYLWLGTYGGLDRFDGVRFAVFDNNSEPRLRRNRVTRLFEDASGTLWIGDELGGVSRFGAGSFEEISVPATWKGAKISAISADEAEDIWL